MRFTKKQSQWLASGMFAALAAGAFATSCGDDAACVPGAQVACACPDGGEGVQVCAASGDSLGACECGEGGNTAAGGGGAGAGAGSEGGAGGQGSCTPNEVVACYDGPNGTLGNGQCAAGTSTCLADGSGFGQCMDWIGPDQENCLTPEDEDCDGDTPPCEELWSVGFAGAEGTATMQRLAIDADGNVIVLGQLRGTVSLAGEPAQQYWRTVLAKFDPAGQLVFALPIGDPILQSFASGVAVDVDGSIFITGSFESSLDIGSVNVTSTNYALFVAKLDPDGNALWADSYDATVNETPIDIGTFDNGDIAITGDFNGQVYFGGSDVLMSSGSPTMYLVRFDTDGGFVWAADPVANPYVNDMDIALGDEVVLVGRYENATDFGLGPLPQDNGNGGAFFAVYDGTGAPVTSQGFSKAGAQASFSSVAIDSTGAFAVTGGTSAPVDFGGGDVPNNMVVAKFEQDGDHVFSHGFASTGSPSSSALIGVGVSLADDVVAGGILRGSLDFGGGSIMAEDLSEFGMLVRFDPAGVWASNQAWGAPLSTLQIIAVEGYVDGTMIIAGSYANSTTNAIDVGQGPFPLAPQQGGFIARVEP